MAQRSKYGLRGGHVGNTAPHYRPPTFTATTAWTLGTVIGLSIVVLVWLALEEQMPG